MARNVIGNIVFYRANPRQRDDDGRARCQYCARGGRAGACDDGQGRSTDMLRRARGDQGQQRSRSVCDVSSAEDRYRRVHDRLHESLSRLRVFVRVRRQYYHSDNGTCQLHSEPPDSFQQVPNCAYYQVFTSANCSGVDSGHQKTE